LLAAFSLFDAIVRRKEYLLHLSIAVGMMVADKSCEVWIARFAVAALMAVHLPDRLYHQSKPSKDIMFWFTAASLRPRAYGGGYSFLIS
jgi:Na+-transporting NADH:ubiquinone oxidoreductase subunit NqrF